MSRFPPPFVLSFAAALLAPIAGRAGTTAAGIDRPFEGFGSATEGGSDGTLYVVSSLANSGTGTLRDAVSAPNRCIVFSIAGTIVLTADLDITKHHLTIDGSTAPFPGISVDVNGRTLSLNEQGAEVAHDVILRHLRFRDGYDNLSIGNGVHDVVIDHCSSSGATDGNLDIYDGSHDLTVQWCILADAHKNQLIRTDCYNLSLHHNLYALGGERNPQVQANSTFVDIVNNVIYGWDPPLDHWGGDPGYGVRIRTSSSGNLIKNYFAPSDSSDVTLAVLLLSGTSVYSEGNLLPLESDDTGTAPVRLPAPPVTEMAPEDAFDAVLAEAGAFPRDSRDQFYVGQVRPLPSGLRNPYSNSGPPIVQVRPNPLVQETTIRYSLATPGLVRLAIHDVLGRRRVLLVDGTRSAGGHLAHWDGRGEQGDRLASGVYFVRLENVDGGRRGATIEVRQRIVIAPLAP